MIKLSSDLKAEAQKPVYNQLILCVGILVAIIGLSGLLGLWLGLPWLQTFLPPGQGASITWVVAISLVALGIAIKTILDSHPYEKMPQWLWPVRYISVLIPFAIGWYWLYSYIADPAFDFLDLSTQGLHAVSFMAASFLVLSASALFLFLIGQKFESIVVYLVDIPALMILNLGILAIVGYLYDIPVLYAFHMALPAGIAAVLTGMIILIATLPFRGLLLPILSDVLKARLMAHLSLGVGFIVFLLGLNSIAFSLNDGDVMDLSRLSLETRHLYTLSIMGINVASIAMTVIALRATRYFSQSMYYAQQQEQAAERETMIRQVVQTVRSSLNLEDVFRQVAVQLGMYLHADRCFVARYDEEMHRLSPPTQEYLSSNQISSMLSHNPSLWEALNEYVGSGCHRATGLFDFHCFMEDLSVDAQDCIRELKVQSGLACPVRYRERCFAFLFVHQVQHDRVWTDDDKEIISEVANQAAIAIYQAELYQHEQATKEALQASRIRLEQSNRDLEQFATVASHDLQAPLRKIKLFCEQIYASTKDKLEPETLELMQRVDRSVTTAQRLVTDLLALSKVTNARQPFCPVDLSVVVQKVLSNLDDQIRAKQAQIEVGELASLVGDPMQFEQLLQNLIENGLKYQPDGQRPVIKIHANCSDEQFCELIVEDNGIGFDSAYAERIFQPFERLHGKSSLYEGTGVGLAICKRIVERHEGTIRAESTPGHGAKFVVRLPHRPKYGEGYSASC